jgi:hypothetical protein
MKRFRGCLMVGFIFLCGFLVGGFLGAGLGWVGFFHKVVKGGPGALREIVMDRTARDLNLQPDQRQRVRRILEETGTELTTATAEVRPQIEEIMGRNSDRLREVLNERQRQKFDRFVTEGSRRWKAAIEAHSTPAPKAASPATPAPEAPLPAQ